MADENTENTSEELNDEERVVIRFGLTRSNMKVLMREDGVPVMGIVSLQILDGKELEVEFTDESGSEFPVYSMDYEPGPMAGPMGMPGGMPGVEVIALDGSEAVERLKAMGMPAEAVEALAEMQGELHEDRDDDSKQWPPEPPEQIH